MKWRCNSFRDKTDPRKLLCEYLSSVSCQNVDIYDFFCMRMSIYLIQHLHGKTSTGWILMIFFCIVGWVWRYMINHHAFFILPSLLVTLSYIKNYSCKWIMRSLECFAQTIYNHSFPSIQKSLWANVLWILITYLVIKIICGIKNWNCTTTINCYIIAYY